MRAEVVTYTHRKLLQKIKFFSDKDPNFLWVILPVLKSLKIKENDFLFREGDFADESKNILFYLVSVFYFGRKNWSC
jgi:hypothetical protein